MTALTNTAIAALRKGDRPLKDDRVPGLEVRAHTDGKSFLLYYRTKGGVPRRPKIGDAAVLPLADAREIARGMLAQVAAGGDPVADRDKARHDPTLDDLWRRVKREHYTADTAWGKEARRLYHNYVSQHKHRSTRLGAVKVRALDIEHVEAVHQALAPTPYQANRVVAILGKAFKLAEKWKMRDMGTNPCAYVTRHRERKRRRFASPDELAKLGPALDSRAEDHPDAIAFLYVLLFSGARPSEIERATPAMLERVERDGVVFGVLRLPDAKTGSRDVFLPAQAMAVLDRLPAGRANLAGREHLPRKIWDKVRIEAGCPDLWARDMRRTFATTAMSNGTPSGQVGELLGHASAQTTKIYAKLMEDPAHRAAAETADALSRMLGDGK